MENWELLLKIFMKKIGDKYKWTNKVEIYHLIQDYLCVLLKTDKISSKTIIENR